MFSFVTLGTNDLKKSKIFYDELLKSINIMNVEESDRYIGYSKKETLEKQIDEEIKKTEQEIRVLKQAAPEKINKIAIETSSELIKKLIGAEVNNSSISAIVDDLSKKNGDKYYGN